MIQQYILDGHKLLWHKERVEAWLRGERIAPITMDCALTRACTYKCVYCYSMLQENRRENLTKDIIFRFLDDAAEIGVKAISLVSDGESTCSPHFYDTIIHGKANGLDMASATNGYLLKKERLPEILPALTYLRYNISAAQPNRYSQIHGCDINAFDKVIDIIKESVKIKHSRKLAVTLGLQLVLMPEFMDQIIPMAKLGKELGVDYCVIKHCSDDETGALGMDYSQYADLELNAILKEAENYSDDNYLVKVKWTKIMSQGRRSYKQCFGPPFIMQLSGSGLVAPCGMLFNEKYKKFHIGNIANTRFKDIWKSQRYWDVISYIASEEFNAQKDCGRLCLQDKVNEFLWDLVKNKKSISTSQCFQPKHINFI